MRPGPSKKKKICQDHKAKGCSSVMGRLPRRAGDAEAKQMQRRDMMGTGFWLQLFLQAQGVFKTKYDFHCQEKLLLSYCLTEALKVGREANWLPPALLVFLEKRQGFDWDTLRDASVENPGCVALTTYK